LCLGDEAALAGDAAVDIAAWLGGLDLERYVKTFRDHEIDSEVLPELTDGALEKLGIPLGHRTAAPARACSQFLTTSR
jgi:SAM domain (Sterile alpha motif)